MGQIEDLRTFVDIVNGGGIARAADTLNIVKSAVSRRLGLLENRYNVQLIDRRPGVWEVTAAGRELHQRALVVLADLEEIDADFSHQRQSLVGPLSVTMPEGFGMGFLQPALLGFANRYPDIQLTVDFDNRHIDLERENYDLAIRIAAEDDPDLVVIPFGDVEHRLYASPDYAERNALPSSLKELTQHPLLHFGSARRAIWEFETDAGIRKIEFQPALNSNRGQFLLAATQAGKGIAILPDFIATDACNAQELIVVLPEARYKNRKITLAYSRKRRLNQRMRTFIDELSSACMDENTVKSVRENL